MKISIVTVCYNNLAGVKKTIESLRTQTSFEFEHWVIDGASKDGTADFLAQLQVPWNFRWVSERDQGIYDAMNKGLRLCKGEYVWFLNSGDICRDSTTLADLLKTVNEHSDCDMIYGRVLVQSQYGLRSTGAEVTEKDFRVWMPICHQSILYKTERIRQQGYQTDYRIISDWILTKDVFKKGPSFFLDRPFAIYDNSGISSLQHWNTIKEKIRFEQSLMGRARIVIISGGKYLAIWLSKKLALYAIYKRIAHAIFKPT